MAFEQVEVRVPSSIGRIAITLETEGEDASVAYTAWLLDADGKQIKAAQGNLVPQLSAEEVTVLQTFMAAQRVKAQALLPAE